MLLGFQCPSGLIFFPVALLFPLSLILHGCSTQSNAPMIEPAPSAQSAPAIRASSAAPPMITPQPTMAPSSPSSPILEPPMIAPSPTPTPSSKESSAPRSEPSMIPTAPR